MRKILKTNRVRPAMKPPRFGKGVPGKGGKTMNFEIPEYIQIREIIEMLVNKN